MTAGREPAAPLFDLGHWPVPELERMVYTVEGETRVLTWEKWWCVCGDRRCTRSWR
jgi:hypothetical protein